MISNEDLIYYNNIIQDIYLNHLSYSYDDLSTLKKNIRDFFKQLTKSENQFFSSTYSRIIFCSDKYNIPKNIANDIFRFRYLANNISRESLSNDIKSIIKLGLKSFYELIRFFDKQNILVPSEISNFDSQIFSNQIKINKKQKTEHLEFISIIVKEKGLDKNESPYIIGYNEETGNLKVYFDKKWNNLWNLLWKTAKIYIFDLNTDTKNKTIYITRNSIIILEPDILLDVTDLSNCFLNYGFTPLPYFLNRLLPKGLSENMIQGTLINSIFDEIISNNEISFDEAYDKAIKNKPLQIFAIASKNMNLLKEIKKWLRNSFEMLKERINEIEGDLISVEPSFYSPIYGLQGRLDLLIEFNNDFSRKNIIELKSGKAPSTDLYIKTSEGNFIKTGLWESHLAQTTCYNMLLDSTFPGRTGSSSILYVSDFQNPFRNAPNIIQKKQDVANGRNIIISLEKKILEADFSFFDEFVNDNYDYLPQYVIRDINEVRQIFRELSPLEMDYFRHYYRFILRETYAARIGSVSDHYNNGKSSIWRDSLDDKIASMDILTNLELDFDNSNFERLHLSFYKPKTNDFISSIRKGDLAILYQISSDGNSSPIHNQIIKCTIHEITDDKVFVSLRNKLLRTDIFNNSYKWAIEPDFIDSTDKYLFHSIVNFLSSEKDKRDLLLGLRKPEIDEYKIFGFENLTHLQNEIVKIAIKAKDYYIIQGPPGTGKTSYILKTIAEHYHNSTDKNVLILAYTNRAVDEICSVLSKVENLKFLRLGSKDSSSFSDYLISYLAEKIPLRDLFRIFKETRFIVSTVSSVLVNPEIFEMKKFHLAIVDEASQILEPQLIGILSKADKFILIGDEKQLPAIVQQDSEILKVNNENLQKIHLTHLSQSLFERLLRCCLANEWEESLGMLTEQARMHSDIQLLANTLFYNNSLKLFDSSGWQTQNRIMDFKNELSYDKDDKLISILLNNRIIFIDSDTEKSAKKHSQEAERIKIILNKLERLYRNNLENENVGIITPFRAQCNEIYRKIDENLKGKITIDTVERFQGSEREIIIISFAVNYPALIRQISSILTSDGNLIDRKLNVAMTRAKKQLIFLGASQVLMKSEIYTRLIKIIKNEFCYLSSDEFSSMIS